MEQLKINDYIYNFQVIDGIVKDEKKNYSSNVTGGGNLNDQGLNSGKISISSTTSIHQDIVVEDSNNQLHHIKLNNWDMPCFVGNHMIFILDANDHNTKYSVTNKTLNKTYYAHILNDISEIKTKKKNGCALGLSIWGILVALAIIIDSDYFLGAFFIGGLVGLGATGIKQYIEDDKEKKYDTIIYQKFKSMLDQEIEKH